jgi:hypothetical protein
MPELVKVITPVGVKPWHQHEPRLLLEKTKKTNVLNLRGIGPLPSPSMFFDHCVTHGLKVQRQRLFFLICPANKEDENYCCHYYYDDAGHVKVSCPLATASRCRFSIFNSYAFMINHSRHR